MFRIFIYARSEWDGLVVGILRAHRTKLASVHTETHTYLITIKRSSRKKLKTDTPFALGTSIVEEEFRMMLSGKL